MIWEDVFFSRNVDPEDIIKTLAHVFEISADMIHIEYGWEWPAGLDDNYTQLLCQLNIIRGDYPIRLKISFLSGWKRELPQDSERYNMMGRLCDLLNNPAIVSADVENPYISTLVYGEEDYQYVYVHEISDPFGLEVTDELYKFAHQLSSLEAEMGSLMTQKDFDMNEYSQDRFMCLLGTSSKDDLLPVLSNLRPEAKRTGREEFLQEAINQIETSH